MVIIMQAPWWLVFLLQTTIHGPKHHACSGSTFEVRDTTWSISGLKMGSCSREKHDLHRLHNTCILIEETYGAKDECYWAQSAGCLLIGPLLTKGPDFFTSTIAEVAFVDVLINYSWFINPSDSSQVGCMLFLLSIIGLEFGCKAF